jgi:hypothetical protein
VSGQRSASDFLVNSRSFDGKCAIASAGLAPPMSAVPTPTCLKLAADSARRAPLYGALLRSLGDARALEGDAAVGITTHDLSDTAMLGYPSVGMSITFDTH